MIVYEARYSGGEYEDKFDFTLGIYDDFDVAAYECIKAMEKAESSNDVVSKETTEFCINVWEVNKDEVDKNIRRWWRRKDGIFVDEEEWDDNTDWGYSPY